MAIEWNGDIRCMGCAGNWSGAKDTGVLILGYMRMFGELVLGMAFEILLLLLNVFT